MEFDPDMKVAELLEQHPRVLDVLVSCGFTPLRIPGVRAAMAHTITLRQACEKREVDLEEVLEKLRLATEGE
jgi:hypothetical protein